MAGYWKVLLKEPWFNIPSKVQIWSDGGPKHFKIASNMRLLQAIQELKPDIQWEYNFFPAYHGCNVCDALPHMQRKKSMKTQEIIINPLEILKLYWKRLINLLIIKQHRFLLQNSSF